MTTSRNRVRLRSRERPRPASPSADIARFDVAVSEGYTSPGRLTGGTIKFVGVTVEEAQYLDLEALAAAPMAVD